MLKYAKSTTVLGIVIFVVLVSSTLAVHDANLRTLDVNQEHKSGHQAPIEVELLPSNIPHSGFIENRGQLKNDQIEFYFHGRESIGFANSSITVLSDDIFAYLTFMGASNVIPMGKSPLSHSVNFFSGSKTLTNVNSFAEIWYNDLYSNIDLRVHVGETGLKYDFIVHPGGNPDTILIDVSGSTSLTVKDSEIYIKPLKDPEKQILWETGLLVYDEDGEKIDAKFTQRNEWNQYGFEISEFDRDKTVIIDPVWPIFSTFFGGSAKDYADDVTVDSEGNIYVTGRTESRDFPTKNAYDDEYYANTDIFVSKLNSTGTGLIYSTYITGAWDDDPYGIEVDAEGNCFIGGWSGSPDYPVYNGYQMTNRLGDSFVTKLNATGNGIIFSTLIGGSHWDRTRGFTIDVEGNSYVTGYTLSDNYPIKNAVQSSLLGHETVFFTKLNATGNGLVFSTYMGGNVYDGGCGYGIATDQDCNSYLVGSTESSVFQIKDALQPTHAGGGYDGFFSKFSSSGALVFSSYLGGGSSDYPRAVTVDSYQNVYITGSTSSSNFPLESPLVDTYQSMGDCFVTKINSSGNGFLFSTYIGGNESDTALDIDLNSYGAICIAGITDSANYPLVNAFQNSGSIFITQFNEEANMINYSTFVGGSSDELGGIHLDSTGVCTVVGNLENSDFITKNAFQSEMLGSRDAFITSISIELDETIPTLAFLNPLNNSIHDLLRYVNISVYDDLSGVRSIEYSWNGINYTYSDQFDSIEVLDNDSTFHLSVRVSDYANNVVEDSLTFTVDSTPPTIVGPESAIWYIEYGEEDTTVDLNWEVTDANPGSYQILLDGSSIASGIWDNYTDISISRVFNTEGVYNFTLLVEDLAENTADIEVTVTVVKITSSTWTPPITTGTSTSTGTDNTDPQQNLVNTLQTGIVLAGVVLVVLIIIVIVKRNK